MTREQLAKEIADRNDRCGHTEDEQICLRPLKHNDDHAYEPIDRVIPFE